MTLPDFALLALPLLVAVAILSFVLRRRGIRDIGVVRSASGAPRESQPATPDTPSADSDQLPLPKDIGLLTAEEFSAIAWLQDQFRSELQQSTGIDISNDRLAQHRIMEAIVQALIRLRSVERTSIELPFIAADASGPKHFRRELDRIEAEAAQS